MTRRSSAREVWSGWRAGWPTWAERRRSWRPTCDSGPRSAGRARSCASASITGTTPASPAWPSRTSRCCSSRRPPPSPAPTTTSSFRGTAPRSTGRASWRWGRARGGSEGRRGGRRTPDGGLGPAVCRPGKMVWVGLISRARARGSGMAAPDEPVLFFKATTAITGPNDDVIIPRDGTKVDWEVELAVVIGRRAAYVERDRALDHVAGYVLHTDYSERSFQLERGGQGGKGKSCDTFAPLGPFLATPDDN